MTVPSYYRLRPKRRAPMHADVGDLDRGAALRIGPAVGAGMDQRAHQFGVEFCVADATASPHLALATAAQAGLNGIRQRMIVGAQAPPRLPDTSERALALLVSSDNAAEWLGTEVRAAYVRCQRAENYRVQEFDEIEICRRYAEVY